MCAETKESLLERLSELKEYQEVLDAKVKEATKVFSMLETNDEKYADAYQNFLSAESDSLQNKEYIKEWERELEQYEKDEASYLESFNNA